MASRTINECDRCRREIIVPATGKLKVSRGIAMLDLCGPCESIIERCLAGEELEVPP